MVLFDDLNVNLSKIWLKQNTKKTKKHCYVEDDRHPNSGNDPVPVRKEDDSSVDYTVLHSLPCVNDARDSPADPGPVLLASFYLSGISPGKLNTTKTNESKTQKRKIWCRASNVLTLGNRCRRENEKNRTGPKQPNSASILTLSR